MPETLQDISRKVDHLTLQMSEITRRLKTVDELKEDLSLFTSDIFSEIISFLGDVDFHFRSEDFFELVKKLLRNIRNLSAILDQLQSFTEMMDDLAPLAKDIFNELVEKVDTLEKKGIIRSVQEITRTANLLLASFEPNEIKNAGDTLIKILSMARPLNRPELIRRLERFSSAANSVPPWQGEKISLFKLIKKANNPAFRGQFNRLLDISALALADNKHHEEE